MAETISQHDQRKRHCPLLGHEIHFGYCRAPASELPCRKIFDCWFRIFDVEAFIRSYYSPADVEKILAPRPDKAATLVELIEQARKRTGGKPS